jgi:hypothetical protein
VESIKDVFMDLVPCSTSLNRRFRERTFSIFRVLYKFDTFPQPTHAVKKYYWLLVTANVPSSPILVTLMMEALCSFKMSVLTRATWPYIPEDGILHIFVSILMPFIGAHGSLVS